MKNEVKVGLLSILAAAILFLGFKFLSGKNIFQSQQAFNVSFTKVDGLLPGNPVTLNGYQVGTVEALELDQQGLKTIIRADLLVDDHIKIPVNAIARIVSADLLGDKAIELVFPQSNATNIEYAQSGAQLNGEVQMDLTESVTKELLPVKKKAEELFGSLDSLLAIVTATLNSENIENTFQNLNKSFESVNGTLANLRRVSSELNGLIVDESDRLHGIIRHVESITKNIDENNDMINGILANTAAITNNAKDLDIAKTGEEINATLQEATKSIGQLGSMVEKINEGEGSLGLLLKDDALYHNLENASGNLDALFSHIKENPGKYVHFSVFSRKDKKDKENRKERN